MVLVTTSLALLTIRLVKEVLTATKQITGQPVNIAPKKLGERNSNVYSVKSIKTKFFNFHTLHNLNTFKIFREIRRKKC